MRKTALLILVLAIGISGWTQSQSGIRYKKSTYMVPMRDGTKLFTVVLTPVKQQGDLPFLIIRTPYGSDMRTAADTTVPAERLGYMRNMAIAGYLFVLQDLRGKFNSEGSFEMNRPLYHVLDKTKTDESTDAWDTVEWLIKNIAHNNGKAGILGISYPGYLALDASVDPHPALKASSPQASPTDMFLGDDFHHNGAFRLSYGFEYSYMVENEKTANSSFPFPQYDVYEWYMKLGPLSNVNEKYFKGKLPAWNDFTKHPNYDEFWKRQSRLTTVHVPQIPILHVGGYYDQEDLNGPQIMYRQLEKADSFGRNHIVLGPWDHGGWADDKSDSLGKINFGMSTAIWFQELQKKWFDYWLKGIGDGKFAEAFCFQTGSNQWKSYENWPPKESVQQKLYIQSNGSVSFVKPAAANGAVSYVSDPANPVPYRQRPVEATYGDGSRWDLWHVEDQRFVTSRPDVVSFVGDTLQQSVTVSGPVTAHVFASTTGTDADFVVKLIDVYPNFDTSSLSMSSYQLPVAMEVFRGRFRKSFDKPLAFVPGKPEEIVIDLHQINHSFLPGHRIMIQVQSSWFPVIDMNPQKFVPNIFEASKGDFIKATQTLYCNSEHATYIELPVVR